MRRMRALAIAAALLVSAPLAATSARAGTSPEPSYVTVMLGRGLAGLCFADSRVVTLDQLSAELAARHVPATALAVINYTGETDRVCVAGRRYASWTDYRRLHDIQGWDVVSEGFNHQDFTTVTASSPLVDRQAAWDDTCGSLPVFRAHGFDATGMYAYAGGPRATYVQQAFVSKCFAWGRHYSSSGNNDRLKMRAPWFQSTLSVGGGRCNDSTLPCYSTPPTTKPYLLPGALATLLHPAPAHWASVQIYNLVTGKRVGERPAEYSWNCSEPDVNLHWTSRTELYCANDFFAALDQRSPTAVATTPLGVARAWGRTSLPGTPRPTS